MRFHGANQGRWPVAAAVTAKHFSLRPRKYKQFSLPLSMRQEIRRAVILLLVAPESIRYGAAKPFPSDIIRYFHKSNPSDDEGPLALKSCRFNLLNTFSNNESHL
jgi:hypothetical protein